MCFISIQFKMGETIYQGEAIGLYSENTFIEFLKSRFPGSEEMARFCTGRGIGHPKTIVYFLNPHKVGLKYIFEIIDGGYERGVLERVSVELFGDGNVSGVEKIILDEAQKKSEN